MDTKITVIYDNPIDAELFEAGYSGQIGLARKIPGHRGLVSCRVLPKEDGSAPPAYRLLDLCFDDYQSAVTAVGTDEAAAFLASVFELATGGVRIVFTNVEDV